MHTQEVSPEVREHDESAIRRELGLADNSTILYEDEGWDSRVYIVSNGAAVFKFPRSPEVKAQYRHEISALRMLEGISSPVYTPRVKWEAPDLAYFGYEGIIGQPLSRRLGDLDTETKTSIGVSIGHFLSLLHGAKLDDVPTNSIEDEIADYGEKYRLARPTLTEAFSGAEMGTVEEFFLRQLPTDMRRLGGELRLSHGDLGPWNIIISPTRELGLIDFGDVGYHDASKDFSGFGDDTILNSALDTYGANDLLREKTALRIKAFPVLDIPFYLGKQDQAGIRACLDLVRQVVIEGEQVRDARFKRD